MAKPMKKQSVKGFNEAKEFAEIDALFKKLENDRSLPTFGQHFMHCLIFGTSERVNLKAMYPKTHKHLSAWLERHNRKVLAARKSARI